MSGFKTKGGSDKNRLIIKKFPYTFADSGTNNTLVIGTSGLTPVFIYDVMAQVTTAFNAGATVEMGMLGMGTNQFLFPHAIDDTGAVGHFLSGSLAETGRGSFMYNPPPAANAGAVRAVAEQTITITTTITGTGSLDKGALDVYITYIETE